MVAARTGLDRRFVGAWLLAEQNGSAAKSYDAKGYNNWLNIARTDSGDAGGAHGSYWSDPVRAAEVTAQWIKGKGKLAQDYGKPAAGITAILKTAGHGVEAQIQALAKSGWASSGYNGGNTLRSLMKLQQGGSTPASSGGSPGETPAAVPSAAAASVTPDIGGTNPSALAALQAALGRAKPTIQTAGLQSPSFAASAATPGGYQGISAGGVSVPEKPDLTAALQAVRAMSAQATPTTPTASTGGVSAPAPSSAPRPANRSGKIRNVDDVLGLTGTVKFDGKPVAAWVGHVLNYARQHGWKGGLSSGYRTDAEQKRIYDSGVRPAAKPKVYGGGGSNHEGDRYPLGAADVTEAERLSQILRRSPYAKILQFAGAKDPVHFSHPHNGSY